MKIGARVWKSAIAVAVAVEICRLLGLETPVFAGIAAIICMQPTVAGSIRKGIERMQATIIGAGFALLALMALDAFPILNTIRPVWVGVTVLTVMLVTIYLNWLDSLVLAAATVVVVMVLPSDKNIYIYSADRTVITLIGILVATSINALIHAPEYSQTVRESLSAILKSTDQAYRQAVKAFCTRDLTLTQSARSMLTDSEAAFSRALMAQKWNEDENRLLKGMHHRNSKELQSLGRVLRAISTIRQNTDRITSVTAEILNRSPKYIDRDAHVYEVLWDLSQLSFTILDDIQAKLDGKPATDGNHSPEWNEEVHKQLIHAIREAYKSPLDIFPLVEVSVVAFEIRYATETLREIDDLLRHIR